MFLLIFYGGFWLHNQYQSATAFNLRSIL